MAQQLIIYIDKEIKEVSLHFYKLVIQLCYSRWPHLTGRQQKFEDIWI